MEGPFGFWGPCTCWGRISPVHRAPTDVLRWTRRRVQALLSGLRLGPRAGFGPSRRFLLRAPFVCLG